MVGSPSTAQALAAPVQQAAGFNPKPSTPLTPAVFSCGAGEDQAGPSCDGQTVGTIRHPAPTAILLGQLGGVVDPTRTSTMAEIRGQLTLTASLSWWVRPYIKSIALFCMITGMQPDMDKVSRTVKRGIKLKFTKKSASSPDGLC